MQDDDRREEQNTSKRRGKRKKRKDGLLTTGDMARLSNSTLRTVRFYEEEDILRPTLRSEGGHRLFADSELEKLLLVSDMRSAGLSLEEIKTILSLKSASHTGAEASKKVGAFLQSQIEAMHEKVLVLQRLQQDFGRAGEVFAKCQHCNNPETHPTACRHCGIMDNPADLPRTVRVLWDLGSDDGSE
ncbi:MAG: MerR family transcriptional regulator [Polyangiaceae bacterium]|nr:MerR family transcriptional regulator [Polyangiaceae bacterium]